MTDEEFLAAFENCTLPRPAWTHEAHLRMAWLYLRRRPYDEVVPQVRAGIRRYNAAVGAGQGYHETVTLAFLRLVELRLNGPERPACAEPFAEFLARCPELVDRQSPILDRHYRRETLEGAQAREVFVEPDLAPFA